MNDKELADKIVALGVGNSYDQYGEGAYSIDHGMVWLQYKNFVRDWRVAGALMEKALPKRMCSHTDEHLAIYEEDGLFNVCCGHSLYGKYAYNESLPRAIIEACVEALIHETL